MNEIKVTFSPPVCKTILLCVCESVFVKTQPKQMEKKSDSLYSVIAEMKHLRIYSHRPKYIIPNEK
jgi:hypothetical protein